MRRETILSVLAATALSACGGSGTQIDDPASAARQVGTSGPHFSTDIGLDPANSGVFSEAIVTDNLYRLANTYSLVAPTGGISFGGTMVAKIGTDETYLSGDMEIDVTFQSGNGVGFVDNLSISGRDTQNRTLSILDQYDIVGTANGTTFTGTISGTVGHTVQVNPIIDDYTIDSTIDARFVDAGPVFGIVGVLDGTLTSNIDGVQNLTGVIVGEDDLTR